MRGKVGLAAAAACLALAVGGCAPEVDAEEYFPRLAACLREAGWEAEVEESGDAMSYSYGSADQRLAFDADKAACDQRIGTPPPPEPLTDAELSAQYRHLVEMRTCLFRLGYPTSSPPSEEVFIESWRATELRPGEEGRVVQDGPWSPYQELPGPAIEEVADQCPQAPASD